MGAVYAIKINQRHAPCLGGKCGISFQTCLPPATALGDNRGFEPGIIVTRRMALVSGVPSTPKARETWEYHHRDANGRGLRVSTEATARTFHGRKWTDSLQTSQGAPGSLAQIRAATERDRASTDLTGQEHRTTAVSEVGEHPRFSSAARTTVPRSASLSAAKEPLDEQRAPRWSTGDGL